jgi:hypothetical protein
VEDHEQSIAGRSEHDYDISRLLAFSDGAFAVAITLLVFNLRRSRRTMPWIRHHQLFRLARARRPEMGPGRRPQWL